MKKLIAALALVACSLVPVAQATGLPVFDAGAFLQKAEQFIEEKSKWVEDRTHWVAQLQRMQQQINAQKVAQDYRVLIDGNWKGRLTQLLHREADKFTRGQINLDGAGWQINNAKWSQVIAQRSAIGALKKLRGVMDGKLAPTNVRESIEAGWGVVPMTADGVRVEAMHQEAATVMMATGQQQAAIAEKAKNIDQLDKEISGTFGFRTPVEVERLKAKQAKETQDLSTLQITAQGYTNRLLAQLVLNESSKISNAELTRLRGVRVNQEGMSLMQFSPQWKQAAGKGVE
ncbi:MAG: hypothetical protein H0U76_28510 [Ktedonobacteraceae bacterium]|nr:hypothetical protein [Ktedonobacteraceae bacterium]